MSTETTTDLSRHRRHWTAAEDQTLRRLYGAVPIRRLGPMLGRTPGTLTTRAYELGIRAADPMAKYRHRSARIALAMSAEEALMLARQLCIVLAMERGMVTADEAMRALNLSLPELKSFCLKATMRGYRETVGERKAAHAGGVA